MSQLTGIQRIFETGMIICTVLALFIFLSLKLQSNSIKKTKKNKSYYN